MPRRPTAKRQLTELFVRKLKPKARAFVVWDEYQRGLAIRVQPTGAKAWYAVYSRRGRPRWLRIGAADAIGLGDARVLTAEAMLAVARGKDPAAEKRAERGAGTFAELAAKYVEQHAKKHNKSWKQAEALIRSHALPRLGKLQASSVSRADIKALMAKLAPVLANQVLASVSAVFTWAIREETVPSNPCKLVDRNETRDRERVLSDSELPRFWAALAGVDPARAAALKMVLLTGQRPGEVAHMRREHIKDGWWELPGEPVPSLRWPGTKNAKSHSVWLPQAARAILAGMGDHAGGFVFRGPHGGPVNNLDIAMRAICAKIGGAAVKPHDLRRTFSTTVAAHYDRPTMHRLTNHSTGDAIGDIYDRAKYAERNKAAWEAVAGRIAALAEGRADDGAKIVQLR